MRLIDRYATKELTKLLLVVLAVVLGSLVLERILRLFDLVSMKGGPFYMVWEMALMLVPHYLGLALPAGFFVAVFLVVSSFNNNNEIDVMLSGGISPVRFSAPFVVAAVVLTGLSVGLFGYIQPYGRYAYHAVHYLVEAVPWNADVPERTFATVDKKATVTADRVNNLSGKLGGVFVHMTDEDDVVAITAKRGRLQFGPEKSYYRLQLFDGTQLVTRPDGLVSSLHFGELTIQRDFITQVAPFRARGDDVRELSLYELSHEKPVAGEWTAAEAKAEFHGRLVRAFSLLFLPFLTIPLALTAKRRQRSAGIVTGAILLVLYHYTLQTLQGMAGMNKLPVTVLWVPLAVYTALSALLFWRTQLHPGQNPLDPLFDAVAAVLHLVLRACRRLRPVRP